MMSSSPQHDHTDHQHGGGCCVQPSPTPSLTQTLDELDWERGIWSAALCGDVARVQKLLSTGCEVNATDKSGYTALHYACRNGHAEVVSTLLEYGAQTNIQTRSGGASALQRAAYGGHSHIVSLLVQSGADTGLQDCDGKTALHKAAERNHQDICLMLLQANPRLIGIEDNKGQTPKGCARDSSTPHEPPS